MIMASVSNTLLAATFLFFLCSQSVLPQTVQDPHNFIQYDVRKMPTLFDQIGQMTEAQFIVKKLNFVSFPKETIWKVFQIMQQSKLEATPSVLNVQEFPYYALRAEDIMDRYSDPDPAVELENMSPVLISCKIDANCAFDDGTYPMEQSSKNKLVGLKVMFGILFLIENLIAIFIPYFFKKVFRKRSDFVLTLCSTFAAGILIGAAFLHLLPTSFDYQKMQVYYNGFPVAMVIALTGYYALFCIDSVLLSGVGDYRKNPRAVEKGKDIEGGNGNGGNGNGHNGNGANGDGKGNGKTDNGHDKGLETGHINPKFRFQRPLSLLFGYLLQCVMIFLAIGLQYNTYVMCLLAVGVFLWEGGEVLAISTYFIRNGASLIELLGVMIPVSFAPTIFLYAGMGIDQINLSLQMTFLALAAGTFIYTACNQILQDDLDHVTGQKSGTHSWIERYLYFTFLCGGILMFVLAKLVPSDYATIRTVY